MLIILGIDLDAFPSDLLYVMEEVFSNSPDRFPFLRRA